MDTLLRKIAEWKGRRKAAQVIVFDGGAEVERTRAFLRGSIVGIGVTAGLFLLTAPGDANPEMVRELDRREALLREADQRLSQAVDVANVCLNTAQRLEQTLRSYEAFLGSSTPPRASSTTRTSAP